MSKISKYQNYQNHHNYQNNQIYQNDQNRRCAKGIDLYLVHIVIDDLRRNFFLFEAKVAFD